MTAKQQANKPLAFRQKAGATALTHGDWRGQEKRAWEEGARALPETVIPSGAQMVCKVTKGCCH